MSEEKPLYNTSTLHYSVVGGHIQDTAQHWNVGAASFPAGTYHEIFQVQMCDEINPSHRAIHRAYLDHQQPLIFASDKKMAANDWIATWCDDTFLQYAPHIWGVCDLNEYFSNGDTAHDRSHKIAWAIAFLEVWSDWRASEDLQHIVAVSSRAAVGNDIPIEVANACQVHGAAISYHPYWPVRNGVILIDSARWYHQRWQHMDAHYKSNGITVPFWVSTEIGAVGYSQSPNGDVHLHPDDGWKHPNVYNGNMPAFIASIQEWAQSVAEWNALNDNRFLGGQLFTTNLPHNGWTHFRITGDELVTIGNAMSAWVPDVPPPPVNEWQRFVDAANSSQTIAQMNGAALQDAIMGHGLQMLGNEYVFTYDNGEDWICRLAGNGDANASRWVYRFPVGNYDPSALVIDEVVKT